MDDNTLKVKVIRVRKDDDEGMVVKINMSKNDFLNYSRKLCSLMEKRLLDFPIRQPWWFNRKCRFCYQFFRNSKGREQWCIRHKTAIRIYSLPALTKIHRLEVKEDESKILFNIVMGRTEYVISWSKSQILITINDKLTFKYEFTYNTFPYLSEYQVITDGLIDTLREIEWYLTEKEDVEIVEENGKTFIFHPKWVRKLFDN